MPVFVKASRRARAYTRRSSSSTILAFRKALVGNRATKREILAIRRHVEAKYKEGLKRLNPRVTIFTPQTVGEILYSGVGKYSRRRKRSNFNWKTFDKKMQY